MELLGSTVDLFCFYFAGHSLIRNSAAQANYSDCSLNVSTRIELHYDVHQWKAFCLNEFE